MGCACSEVQPRTGDLLSDLQNQLADKVRREMLLPMGLAFAGGAAIGLLVGGLIVYKMKR